MTDTIANVSDIRPDAKQPRKYFKAVALKALARSLELVGQRTPIEVKRLPTGGKHRFEIIDGERRWRAHQIAGMTTIRITVEEQAIDARKQHLLSTISNFHREGHTHLEISDALAYQRALGESAAVLAENLAKSEPWVYTYLQLQKLAPKLKEKMHPECDASVVLKFAEAVVLASLPTAQQIAIYKEGLHYERGERLPLYRKRAGSVQGKERTGRQMRVVERVKRIDSFVDSLNRYFEIALDLKQKDFERMIESARAADMKRLVDRLSKLIVDAGILMTAIARKQGRA